MLLTTDRESYVVSALLSRNVNKQCNVGETVRPILYCVLELLLHAVARTRNELWIAVGHAALNEQNSRGAAFLKQKESAEIQTVNDLSNRLQHTE